MTEVLPAHTRLSASGAKRWMNCSGSVALLAAGHYPEDDFDDSEWSREGTAAHTLGAHCLMTGAEPYHYLGQWIPVNQGHIYGDEPAGPGAIQITRKMVEAVTVYVEYCLKRDRENPDWIWKTEQRVDDKTFHPDFGGTADRYGVGNYWLEVVDYKNGAGVTVDVEENEQLMYYGYGILRKWPMVQDIRLTIVQPNGYHPDGAIRSWCISAYELKEWAEKKLAPAMKKVDSGDTALVPGAWCQFCPRKIRCPRLVADAKTLATIEGHQKKPVDLDNEAIAVLLDMAAPVMSLFKSLKQEAERRLLLGQEIEGQKLVRQKADRVWNDAAEARLRVEYGNDAFVTKLRSPAQVEDLPGGKAIAAEYGYKPDVGLAIAPLSDKRAAQKPPTAAEIFNLDKIRQPE